MFSCEFCEISKYTFSTERFRTTASENKIKKVKQDKDLISILLLRNSNKVRDFPSTKQNITKLPIKIPNIFFWKLIFHFLLGLNHSFMRDSKNEKSAIVSC